MLLIRDFRKLSLIWRNHWYHNHYWKVPGKLLKNYRYKTYRWPLLVSQGQYLPMLFANVLLEHIDLGSRAADIVIVKSFSLSLSLLKENIGFLLKTAGFILQMFTKWNVSRFQPPLIGVFIRIMKVVWNGSMNWSMGRKTLGYFWKAHNMYRLPQSTSPWKQDHTFTPFFWHFLTKLNLYLF